MNSKVGITISIFLWVASVSVHAEAPGNAHCVAKHFREYIDVKTELYQSIAKEMKKNHSELHPVIKSCIDVFIADANLSLVTFDKWWEESRDRIFSYSKKLHRLGAHYDRNALLKKEIETSELKNPYPVKQRKEA